MKRFALSATAVAVASVSAANAELVTVSGDLSGDYSASEFSTMLAGFSGGEYAGAVIVSWGFSNVAADVYWNSGSSFTNWASELRIGILDFSIGDTAGDVYWTYANPFSANSGASTSGGSASFSGGNFSSGDVSSNGWNIGSEGDVNLVAISSWNDGTGLAAGTITGGTGWITIDTIPAPGALALLGLAGLAGRRRRR